MSEEMRFFWKECVRRRREQLELHRQSWRAVVDKMIEYPLYDEAKCAHNDKVQRLKDAQGEWIDEAEKKLKHAENMLSFFERGVL